MPLPPATLADALLAFIRRSLSLRDLQFAETPFELTGGYDTTILAFQLANAPAAYSKPLVLRLLPSLGDGPRVARENAAHTSVISAGFPAPRILFMSLDGVDLGLPILIMERLPGQNLWDNAFGPNGKPSRVLNITRVLAQTQRSLHALDPQRFANALSAGGLDADNFTLDGELQRLQDRIERADLASLADGVTWLRDKVPPKPDAPVICHGDFHPLNIVMDGDRLSGVVDWSHAIVADPAYDVACTTVLLRFGPADVKGLLGSLFDLARAIPIRRYLGYTSQRHLDTSHLRYYQCVRALSSLTHSREPASRATSPWREPRTATGLASYFRELSGVRVDK